MKTFLLTALSLLLSYPALFAAYQHTIRGTISEFEPHSPTAERTVYFQSDDFPLDTLTQLENTGYFSITFLVDTDITAPVRIVVSYTDPCFGEGITETVQVAAEGITEMEFPACPDPLDCTAGFIPAYDDVDPLTVTFADESGSATIATVFWNFGDGTTSTAFNPTHTYAERGEYLVSYELTTADSCTARTELSVRVGDLDWHLQCVASISSAPNYMLPQQIHFYSETVLPAIDYRWDFGDGSVSTEQYPVHVYAAAGNYEVNLTATLSDGTDTCTAEASLFIYVDFAEVTDLNCVAEFDIIDLGDTRLHFGFLDYSVAEGEITDWLWDFGDGTTSTERNPEHIYADTIAGNQDITLRITTADSCVNQVTYQLYVGEWMGCGCGEIYDPVCGYDVAGNLLQYANPCEAECAGYVDFLPCADECSAFFSWEQVASDSSDYRVQFFSPITDDIVEVLWDFGDGNHSQEATPLHTYLYTGEFEVTLTITTSIGCTAQFTQIIYLEMGCHCPAIYDPVCVVDTLNNVLTFDNHCFAECEGYYNYYNCADGGENGNYCQAMFWFTANANGSVQFEDISLTGETAVNWEWDFGDGNTSNEPHPLHTYAEAGIYFVTLTVSDPAGCSSSFSMLVWTNEEIFAEADCRALFFPIVQNNQVILLDVSLGNVVNWEWDLGDGTTASTPFVQHRYTGEGEVIITLKITTEAGCVSEFAIVLDLESGNFHGASDPVALRTATDELQTAPFGVRIFPNPVINTAQLQVNSPQAAAYQLSISNITGQVLRQTQGQLVSDMQQITVDLEDLNPGIYLLTLRSANAVWSEKVVKW